MMEISDGEAVVKDALEAQYPGASVSAQRSGTATSFEVRRDGKFYSLRVTDERLAMSAPFADVRPAMEQEGVFVQMECAPSGMRARSSSDGAGLEPRS